VNALFARRAHVALVAMTAGLAALVLTPIAFADDTPPAATVPAPIIIKDPPFTLPYEPGTPSVPMIPKPIICTAAVDCSPR